MPDAMPTRGTIHDIVSAVQRFLSAPSKTPTP